MGPLHVLVVDDDPAHGEETRLELERLGANVAVADTVARAHLALNHAGIDLVLLDVFLRPGTPDNSDSLALAAACSARGTPCVAISSLADWRIVERFERAGCVDFIEKRSAGDLFDGARLAHILRSVRHDPTEPWHAYGLVGHGPAMQRLWTQIETAAAGDEPVLIIGSTGSGKELAAHAVHRVSRRSRHEPLVLNCASLPDSLVEAELFGFVKGCFTGATHDLPGWFESAEGSSLILDEVGDLSLPAQAKVLRALEAGEIQRIGDRARRSPDIRLLYVTQSEPVDLHAQGILREDLRFRLENSYRVTVPPLKEHKDDIVALLHHFIKPDRPLDITTRAMARLREHDWPGNVRELKGLALRIRARLLARRSWTVELGDVSGLTTVPETDSIPSEPTDLSVTGGPLGSRFAWNVILNALIRNRGHRENTAGDLGVDRKTLVNWRKQAPPEVLKELERHGIRW